MIASVFMGRGGVLAVTLAAVTASAAPGSARSAEPCAARSRGAVEVLPRERNGGSFRVFARPEGGFDLFWGELTDLGDIERAPPPPPPVQENELPALPARGVPDAPVPPPPPRRGPRFATFHRVLAADGTPAGKPVKLLDEGPKHLARGEGATWAIVAQRRVKERWRVLVTAVRIGDGAPKVLREVMIPLEGFGHATVAIAWDAVAREWVVAGEEQVNEPDKSPGYVYNRVFTGRLAPDLSRWTAELQYLTGAFPESGTLSDWGPPIVQTARGVAFVWSAFRAYGPSSTVRITELVAGEPPVHHDVAETLGAMRPTIATTPRGYAVSWGDAVKGTHKYEVKAALWEDGRTIATHTLSVRRGEDSATESLVASDGSRVLIAWQQGWGETGGDIHLAELPLTGTAKPERRALTKRRAQHHDWVQSLVWDGCAFTLVWMNGLNPTAAQLDRIP